MARVWSTLNQNEGEGENGGSNLIEVRGLPIAQLSSKLSKSYELRVYNSSSG